MGLNLGIVNETFVAPTDYSWLGSAHGTEEADPVTLASAAFLAVFPTGIVPAGTVIAKYTSGANTGLYGPYADAGATGLDTAAYHLLTTTDVSKGNTAAAGLWHGEVVEARLSANHGLTAAAKADLVQVRYK